MTTTAIARARPLFEATLVRAAIRDSFIKLAPWVQWRNPVMFVVLAGSVMISALWIAQLSGHLATEGTRGFVLAIALWLWATLLFANFAESLAEGRGKAQAASLRASKHEVSARRFPGGHTDRGFESVPSRDLRRGNVVLVEAGDTIPGDGEVIFGTASVDESAITGESAPVIREAGGDRSAVTGGTRLLSDSLHVRITANPGEAFLDRMIAMVEGAKRQRTPNEIALAILLAALTVIFLKTTATLLPFSIYSVGAAGRGVPISITALVALLVCLIPTTIGGLLSAIGIAGMDRMIQANVIATSGRAVEAAGDVDVLLLDKTGTITLGNRLASRFIPAPGVSMEELADAAQLSSLADETPEGRSIVVLAKQQHGIRGRDLAALGAHFVPFSAQTRMSGVDFDGRERRTALLYAMSRQLAMARSRPEMADIAIHHVSEVFASRVAVLFPDEHGHTARPPPDARAQVYAEPDTGVAQWVFDHGKPAGVGTDTLSGTAGLYLPLSGGERVLGTLAVLPDNPRRVTLPEQFRLLETFAAQIGLALARAQFAQHAQAAEVRAEAEAIRNALLASISHDLRTPLATIAGGAATLAGSLDSLSAAERHALAASVSEEAGRMSARITTLLDLVRLETGALQPRLDVYSLEEIVGSVLHRLEQRLYRHRVRVEIPDSVPLLRIDGRLIEQVLENLLDNAAKYTPTGTSIRISASAGQRQVEVSVEDDGPGLPVADPQILFEKFQRGAPESAVGGIGLGLAICRTILALHHGRVWAENRAPHGAAFRFKLPLPENAPPLPAPADELAAP